MYRTFLNLTTLLLAITLSSCAQHKRLVQNPQFNIENPSFSSWMSNDVKKSSGMNLRFTAKNLPKNITLDSIFFKGQFASITAAERQDEYIARFVSEEKKDVIISSDMSKETNNPRPRIPQKSPVPIEPNEALLIYTTDGKKQYHKITSLKDKGTKTPGEKPFN